jgi:predicted CXXCH cytochrome family protein
MFTRSSTTTRRWRVVASRLTPCLILVALILGCSARKHYKTLSFFFDGVPDPSAPAAGTALAAERAGQKFTVYVHKPYAENDCNACHTGDRRQFFTLAAAQGPKPESCLKCHQDVPHKYSNMHGPVAVNACTWCHSPHQSLHPHLLKNTPNKVCMQCHGPTGLSPSTANHADPKANCLDCHSGHGGERNLLKAGWVAMETGSTDAKSGAADAKASDAGDGGVR